MLKQKKYIRENLACNHGTQGTVTSRLFKSRKNSIYVLARPHPNLLPREKEQRSCAA
jgi:hypothetical protein